MSFHFTEKEAKEGSFAQDHTAWGPQRDFHCSSRNSASTYQSIHPPCQALWLGALRQFRPILGSCAPGLEVQEAEGAQKRVLTGVDVWGNFLSWKIRRLTWKCLRPQGDPGRGQKGAQVVGFFHQ